MKRSLASAIAGLLIVLAAWLTGAECSDDALACHVMHLQRLYVAVGEVLANVGP